MIYHPISELNGKNLHFFSDQFCDLNLSQKTSDFFNDFDHIFIEKHLFNKFFIEIVFTMSLILSEYIEPFSACLIKSVCKIFDVKVTNTHCCSLAKNDIFALLGKFQSAGLLIM